jgi:hypothetical protein
MSVDVALTTLKWDVLVISFLNSFCFPISQDDGKWKGLRDIEVQENMSIGGISTLLSFINDPNE